MRGHILRCIYCIFVIGSCFYGMGWIYGRGLILYVHSAALVCVTPPSALETQGLYFSSGETPAATYIRPPYNRTSLPPIGSPWLSHLLPFHV
jgi:hypothetical protein